MLQFQPPGFGQQVIKTSLGVMAYYTPVGAPWRSFPSEGQDLPPIVFLHSLGGGSSAYEWSKVYPAFAPNYRIIAPDLIGWGQSAHPVRNYRVDDYLTIVTELLESLDAPATVVASSLTAAITVRLAVQRSELFRTLFLVCPAGYAEFGADYGRGIAAQLAGTPGLDRLIYTLGAANEFAIRNFLENFLFADRSRLTHEMVSAYLASAQQFNAEYSALSSLRGDLCFDLGLYIGQLQVPTVIVWGEKSRFGRPDMGNRFASLNRRAIRNVWTIPNAGVLPHLEVGAIVIGLLQRALNESRYS
ncbi:MAG: alpha/beta hydrolase [Cyanobacteria bacterium CRU_2_1]|nr:alpha/beta hydrolase [Cyanobacteria bacterium CRU_2_1]